MPTIYKIIIIALLVAFIILFANKSEIRIKLRDFCDEHKMPLIAKMLDCDFCLSFWAGVILSIAFAIATKDISCILIPFLSTPITRFLL